MHQQGITIILQAFASLSLSEKDYLSYDQLHEAINKLNAEPFDQQTFQELWDQCKLNSKGQAKLSQFAAYVFKAEEILAEKLKNAETNIFKLETNKKPKTNEFIQQQQFKKQLQELQDDRDSIQLSLKIIRKPFLNFEKYHSKDKSFEKSQQPPNLKPQKSKQLQKQDNQQHLFDYDSSQTVQTLTKIFYWTVTVLVLNSLCSYALNRFVDMSLCVIVLAGYCLQSLNRKIVKLNLYLLAFSITYTFLWLVIYTDKLWYPNKSVDFPQKYSSFMKICIMAIITGQIIKMLLCYYYLTLLHIEQDQGFLITINQKHVFLTNDTTNSIPQKNPLVYALKDVFNTKKEAPQQLQLQV